MTMYDIFWFWFQCDISTSLRDPTMFQLFTNLSNKGFSYRSLTKWALIFTCSKIVRIYAQLNKTKSRKSSGYGSNPFLRYGIIFDWQGAIQSPCYNRVNRVKICDVQGRATGTSHWLFVKRNCTPFFRFELSEVHPESFFWIWHEFDSCQCFCVFQLIFDPCYYLVEILETYSFICQTYTLKGLIFAGTKITKINLFRLGELWYLGFLKNEINFV